MQKVSRERFEYFKQEHYKLWDWLSKNPDKDKSDYFAKEENKDYIPWGMCFACQFGFEAGTQEERNCNFCPINICGLDVAKCLDGLYDNYVNAKQRFEMYRFDPQSRHNVVSIAKRIRDLPWSEEYVEDEKMSKENYIVINGKKAELTEEQLKQLGIEIGKNKRWRNEEGELFWAVNTAGELIAKYDIGNLGDYCYDTHNYFKTEEEAKEYANFLETKRQLMKFADEHNNEIDWNDIGTFGYQLYWSLCSNKVEICMFVFKPCPEAIYFSSEEIARHAIEEIGEEAIIKYLTYNY